ncbi:MAG: GatB/YqeY domain-containing protein [Sphingobacteriales bacterium]|jgi:uncharacterized protein YqeY|nr:GatB/YqeY domain-containing protein [Sphingobacteriales bacterium]
MSLESAIQSDLKTAMLAKDEAGLRALRAIKSAILLAKTASASKEIGPDEELRILQKLVKQRLESITIYQTQERDDLARPEQEEVEIISKYLPKMMDETEVRAAVAEAIAQTGASAPSDMGKVMGVVTKQLAGKADNKLVSAIVRELLTS